MTAPIQSGEPGTGQSWSSCKRELAALTCLLTVAIGIYVYMSPPDFSIVNLTSSRDQRLLWNRNSSMAIRNMNISNIRNYSSSGSQPSVSAESPGNFTTDEDKARNDTTDDSVLDFKLALWGLPMNGEPLDYLSRYKNPCWYVNSSSHVHTKVLRCLPYLYQLGVAKSGTTSLFNNLIKHPDIYPGYKKELFFWNDPRMRRKFLSQYIKSFDKATKAVEASQNTAGYHEGITLEATPAYFTNNGDLSVIPNNWNTSTMEPRYTLAHTLYALNPNTRLLVSLRHPTDRLFSQYHHMHKDGFGAKDFHEHSVAAVVMMTSCLAKRSLRSCAYDHHLNGRIKQDGRIKLHFGMYYPYAHEWLSVFPRKQVKLIIAEDWYFNSTRVIAEIFDFLEMRHPENRIFRDIEEYMKSYRTSTGRDFTDSHSTFHNVMWPKTRRLLDKFYEPFNIKLAALLGDERFMFVKK